MHGDTCWMSMLMFVCVFPPYALKFLEAQTSTQANMSTAAYKSVRKAIQDHQRLHSGQLKWGKNLSFYLSFPLHPCQGPPSPPATPHLFLFPPPLSLTRSPSTHLLLLIMRVKGIIKSRYLKSNKSICK